MLANKSLNKANINGIRLKQQELWETNSKA